jgi:repressor LexA
MATLTHRQREIYEYLREFINAHGHSPTVFDIAKRFRLRATSTVTEHLKSLEQAGVIKRGSKNALVQLPERIEAPQTPKMVTIPFYGRIAAGAPLEAINEDAETVFVPPEFAVGDCYALRARGDSMIEDGILDGDLLIIRHCREAEQGQTVVALVDGNSATVKRFYRRGQSIILEPANQRLRPLTLRAAQVEVQGVVQAVLRIY